jgi:hypothetical protein
MLMLGGNNLCYSMEVSVVGSSDIGAELTQYARLHIPPNPCIVLLVCTMHSSPWWLRLDYVLG